MTTALSFSLGRLILQVMIVIASPTKQFSPVFQAVTPTYLFSLHNLDEPLAPFSLSKTCAAVTFE